MLKTFYSVVILILLHGVTARLSAETLAVADLDLSQGKQFNLNPPKAGEVFDKEAFGKKIPIIAGKTYERGIGVIGPSVMAFALYQTGERFSALAGVDDEVRDVFKGPAECLVIGDGRTLWRSGQLAAGTKPHRIDVDVRGIRILELVVEAAGDNVDSVRVDWVEATLTYTGEKPRCVELSSPPSEAVILTPPTSATPRINGARVFGVRPGAPFLFTIAATGARPMTFAVDHLPEGLTFDAATGQIGGSIAKTGTYCATLHARNAAGTAKRDLRIVVGEQIALSPPMGWSSWNYWGPNIDQSKALRAARALVASGLINHGFTYINIDDGWQAPRGGLFNALQGNARFPDMKAMCDEIHSLGLKVGIYSTPWTTSFAGYPGGSSDDPKGKWQSERKWGTFGKYSFMANDARQWAAWGTDYLKCDWWPPDPDHAKEVASALRACGRDIVFSLSCNAPFKYAPSYPGVVQLWRTTTDIDDTWQLLSGIAFSQDRWAPFGGPGHWIDPDYIAVGVVSMLRSPHPTRLTPDEQYLQMSMWCLLSAPLILGCDLEKLDAFTLNLLTNDEVLDIDQDPLGRPARRVSRNGYLEVWAKPLESGALAVGLFNRGRESAIIHATWEQLGLKGKQMVRDLWQQQNLGVFADRFRASVNPHGAVLVRISPTQ